ncbi:hypothetical protein PV326_012227 [Microctonus aethiopoides]|nr:hypothetical protein PV326_012227 [Microctonus aethiopoides]
MPKINKSVNLSTYGRTRRWQILKSMRNAQNGVQTNRRVQRNHQAPSVVHALLDLPGSSNVTNACSTSNINQIEELAADHENDERYEDAMYDDNTCTNEDTSSISSNGEHDVDDTDSIQMDDENAFDAHELPNPHEEDIPLYDGAQITQFENTNEETSLLRKLLDSTGKQRLVMWLPRRVTEKLFSGNSNYSSTTKHVYEKRFRG